MHFRGRYCSLPCLLQARLGDIRDVGCNCDRQTREYNTFQRRAGDFVIICLGRFPSKSCGCVCICVFLAWSWFCVPFDAKHFLQNFHKSTASAKSLRFLGRRRLGTGTRNPCGVRPALLKSFHVEILKSADTYCENKIPIMQPINTQLKQQVATTLRALSLPLFSASLYPNPRTSVSILASQSFPDEFRIGSQSAQRVDP